MGQLNIPDGSIVYLDTSILIYTIEKFPNYLPLLEPMWEQLETGKIQAISSELTLMETLVLLFKNSNSLLINAYESILLAGEIRSISITQSILKKAAEIRANFNLKTPDAIHAATDILTNCTVFFTNDRGFDKVSALPVIIINDVFQSN